MTTKAKIYISGRITKGETLVDVIRQFKSFEDVTEIEAVIDSNGGNKNEGEAVYDYLKNLDAEIPVTTRTGKAYSIAAKIFAAGSTRIVEDVDDALMIHFARAKTEGTADELEEIAAELRAIEDEFIEFYSEHLDIDAETVRNLLDNETFVSGKDAVELGFATEVETPVEVIAELHIEKSNIDKMTKEKKEKGFFKKMIADINAYLNEEEIVAELTLQDSNATDIVFPDLESGAVPVVDDKATIDGAAIPDGSYIMPSLEDATYVFADGKVSEIIPKEEEEEETDAEKETRLAAEAEAAKTDVNAEEVQQISVWTMNVLNTSFEVGDVVKREGWEEGTEEIVGAGEYQLEDGRRVITDATGKIVLIKEAEAAKDIEVDTEEAEASFEGLKVKMKEKIKAEVSAEHEAALTEKENEITALKAKQTSKEINAEGQALPVIGKTKGSRAAEILAAGREN